MPGGATPRGWNAALLRDHHSPHALTGRPGASQRDGVTFVVSEVTATGTFHQDGPIRLAALRSDLADLLGQRGHHSRSEVLCRPGPFPIRRPAKLAEGPVRRQAEREAQLAGHAPGAHADRGVQTAELT